MKIDAVPHTRRASEKAGTTMKKQQPITLWNVIESMQRKLEHQGLDAASADETIMRRLGKSLRARRYSRAFHLASGANA